MTALKMPTVTPMALACAGEHPIAVAATSTSDCITLCRLMAFAGSNGSCARCWAVATIVAMSRVDTLSPGGVDAAGDGTGVGDDDTRLDLAM